MNMHVSFAEENSSFRAGFGETSVLHDGQNGATFTPAVSDEGVISWTNDRDLPNPEPVNIKGKDGAPGEKGEQGERGLQGIQGEKGEKGDPGEPGKQGIQGVPGEKGEKGDPGKDGVDGQPGQDGKDGQPGADGISPTVSVQDISGGHRVTITDAEGAKEFDVMDGKDGEGGGSGGGDLPTGGTPYQQLVTDADGNAVWEDRAYYIERKLAIAWTGEVETSYNDVYGAFLKELTFIHPVGSKSTVNVCLNDTDYNSMLIQETPLGKMAGNLSMLNVAFGTNYEDTGEPFILADITEGGALVTTNLFESTTFTIVITFDGDYEFAMTIKDYSGLPYAGTGENAEAFNDHNKATGGYSHAEGKDTVAMGDKSHAEGGDTIAEGSSSHAEGFKSFAYGIASHAEGSSTHAYGVASHAEGSSTYAYGDASHAEGLGTVAIMPQHHVEGKYNIVDGDTTGEVGKYAHIVGNGTSDKDRSNAHTLDWEGNAWYAGDVYVGSASGTNKDDSSVKLVANGDDHIILTSPNGTKYRITVSDDGTLTATAQ